MNNECTICADENTGKPLTPIDTVPCGPGREEHLCDHCALQVREFMHLLNMYAMRGRCTMMRDQRESRETR